MPQIIIDPEQLGTPNAQLPFTILPDSVRKFGFAPDFRLCKPGDLILFRDRFPALTSRLISSAQAKSGFHDDHSCWTHAAVFLYDDFIVEADLWPGVHTRTIYKDIPSSVLRVRRRPDLQDIERYQIALPALRMIGARYGKIGAVRMGFRMLSGIWDQDKYYLDSPVICSKVFFDAHAEITRHLLKDCPVSGPVFPAHLSATEDLEDIEIPWLRL